MCGLVKRESLVDIDIGYGFLAAARGHGYALESALAIKRWAVETLGMVRLVAIVSPDNQPSVTLLEKLGMRFETMIRLVEGDEDICLYAWNAHPPPVVVDPHS
jgi:RimJ/RimL family protein N-acetyltransferase